MHSINLFAETPKQKKKKPGHILKSYKNILFQIIHHIDIALLKHTFTIYMYYVEIENTCTFILLNSEITRKVQYNMMYTIASYWVLLIHKKICNSGLSQFCWFNIVVNESQFIQGFSVTNHFKEWHCVTKRSTSLFSRGAWRGWGNSLLIFTSITWIIGFCMLFQQTSLYRYNKLLVLCHLYTCTLCKHPVKIYPFAKPTFLAGSTSHTSHLI